MKVELSEIELWYIFSSLGASILEDSEQARNLRKLNKEELNKSARKLESKCKSGVKLLNKISNLLSEGE